MFVSEGPAKSRTHPLGVLVICLDRCVVIAPLGAYPWWGGHLVPRYQGPLGWLSKRRQGGPWAPPPCGLNSPGKLSWSMLGWCFGSSVFCLFFVKPLLFLRGRCLFLVLWALHDPTRVSCLFVCPPRSFRCLILSTTPCLSLSLSLSLSGAGETQTFLVWVSPCVFAATISFYDPYFKDDTYTKVSTRTCFFFSFSFDVARLSGGCWLWFVVFDLGLSLSLSVVWLHWVLACTYKSERGGCL